MTSDLASLPGLAGTEFRTFLPTQDFKASEQFYQALGFDQVGSGEVAIFICGAGGIILQRYFVQEWAENCMMSLMVDDLDAWWSFIERLDLSGRFGVRAPIPPEIKPWGLRVAHVFDPAGVLWHVTQRPPAG